MPKKCCLEIIKCCRYLSILILTYNHRTLTVKLVFNKLCTGSFDLTCLLKKTNNFVTFRMKLAKAYSSCVNYFYNKIHK